MRTEEQPEIVEEGLKEGRGGEREEIAPLNPANIATDRRKKETRGIVPKYVKNGGIKTKTASM